MAKTLAPSVQAVIGGESSQKLEIEGWLPASNANVHADGWRKRQARLKAAQVMVWAAAKQAGWQPVCACGAGCACGRAKLTITLVFGQKRRRDTDNLYSRVKGLIDGLVKGGWLQDDSSDMLELVVNAAVSREWNGTKMKLEAVR